MYYSTEDRRQLSQALQATEPKPKPKTKANEPLEYALDTVAVISWIVLFFGYFVALYLLHSYYPQELAEHRKRFMFLLLGWALYFGWLVLWWKPIVFWMPLIAGIITVFFVAHHVWPPDQPLEIGNYRIHF